MFIQMMEVMKFTGSHKEAVKRSRKELSVEMSYRSPYQIDKKIDGYCGK